MLDNRRIVVRFQAGVRTSYVGAVLSSCINSHLGGWSAHHVSKTKYQSQFQRSAQSEKWGRYSPHLPTHICKNILEGAAFNFRETLCVLYLGSNFLEGSISCKLNERNSCGSSSVISHRRFGGTVRLFFSSDYQFLMWRNSKSFRFPPPQHKKN